MLTTLTKPSALIIIGILINPKCRVTPPRRCNAVPERVAVTTPQERKQKMKKTVKMAVIGQLNRATGNYAHIERRVYEDENGLMCVKINGGFISLSWLYSHGRTVDIYY